MFNYFTKENLKKGDESITEGIGQARVNKKLGKLYCRFIILCLMMQNAWKCYIN